MASKKEEIMERLKKEEETAKEIAEAVGCATQYVRDIAYQYRLRLKRERQKPRPSERYPVLARLMREEYVTTRDMGKLIHLSGEAVRNRISRGWNFPEADKKAIQAAFFPEVPVDKLFGSEDDQSY